MEWLNGPYLMCCMIYCWESCSKTGFELLTGLCQGNQSPQATHKLLNLAHVSHHVASKPTSAGSDIFCFEITFIFLIQSNSQRKLELIIKKTPQSDFDHIFVVSNILSDQSPWVVHFSEPVWYCAVHCQRKREELYFRPRWSWGGSAICCLLPCWTRKGKKLHPNKSEILFKAPLDIPDTPLEGSVEELLTLVTNHYI